MSSENVNAFGDPCYPSEIARAPFRVGDYMIGRLLGVGSFSRVFSCADKDGHVFAMKILNRVQNNRSMDSLILREAAVMQKLSHPFIIDLHDVMKSKRHFYFVLELLEGGDLITEIEANWSLSEERCRHYFHQLIVGVRCMHKKGIAHRDLKSQNLLLDDDGNLRISDFGLSTIKQADGMNQTQCGTLAYMAPEVLLKRRYDGFAADMWACGCILYHMLVGRRPFVAPDRERLKKKILEVKFDPIPDSVSSEAASLIRQLLCVPPEERLTVEEVIVSPWFAVGFDHNLLSFGEHSP